MKITNTKIPLHKETVPTAAFSKFKINKNKTKIILIPKKF